MYHEQKEKTPVIFLMGPTASGKTALALTLARLFPLEIINADSVQIYRGMDIGSAKPTLEQRQQVPHHLLDVTDPDAPWSADRYRDAAWSTIRECHARQVIPLFVGGSGLYLRAVERGLALTPPVPDAMLHQIRNEALQLGWPGLHARLAQVDPSAAQRITPGDGQRILRALSVFESTGIPLTEWYHTQPPPPPFTMLKLSIETPRPILYHRIETRFDLMMEQGLLQEATVLWQKGYDRTLPAMKAVGYRQLFDYLDHLCSLTQAMEHGRRESRRYAKRQETWLKQEPDLTRLTGDDLTEEAIRMVTGFLLSI
ncbi:MAG: tRNA (adenosine(37)-N6)-dimethylallyltransferase MiaA [Magnetococcus sp. YQC-5]